MPRRSPARALRAHRRSVLIFTATVLVLLSAPIIAPTPVAASWALVHNLLTPSHSTAEDRSASVSARGGSGLLASDDAWNAVLPCVAPDGTAALSANGCETATPAGDDHPAPIEVPPWQDPGLPAESTHPAESTPSAEEPQPGDNSLPDATAGEPLDISATGFVWPVAGVLTSLFGPAHPLGIDIATNAGHGVGAVADGRVAVATYDPGYGYYVLINHSDGYATLYGHFMAPPEVNAGDTVRRGQIVGYIGSTGRSTGPHLHFEVRLFDQLLDPLAILPSTQLVIDPIAYREPGAAPIACPDSGAIPLQVPADMEDLCPSASPAPTPTPTPTPTPSPSPTPEPVEPPAPEESVVVPDAAPAEADEGESPALAPAVSAEAASPATSPAPEPTPSPSPTPTPTPRPTPTPSPSPSPSPTPTPSPSPTPTPSPPSDFSTERASGGLPIDVSQPPVWEPLVPPVSDATGEPGATGAGLGTSAPSISEPPPQPLDGGGLLGVPSPP